MLELFYPDDPAAYQPFPHPQRPEHWLGIGHNSHMIELLEVTELWDWRTLAMYCDLLRYSPPGIDGLFPLEEAAKSLLVTQRPGRDELPPGLQEVEARVRRRLSPVLRALETHNKPALALSAAYTLRCLLCDTVRLNRNAYADVVALALSRCVEHAIGLGLDDQASAAFLDVVPGLLAFVKASEWPAQLSFDSLKSVADQLHHMLLVPLSRFSPRTLASTLTALAEILEALGATEREPDDAAAHTLLQGSVLRRCEELWNEGQGLAGWAGQTRPAFLLLFASLLWGTGDREAGHGPEASQLFTNVSRQGLLALLSEKTALTFPRTFPRTLASQVTACGRLIALFHAQLEPLLVQSTLELLVEVALANPGLATPALLAVLKRAEPLFARHCASLFPPTFLSQAFPKALVRAVPRLTERERFFEETWALLVPARALIN